MAAADPADPPLGPGQVLQVCNIWAKADLGCQVDLAHGRANVEYIREVCQGPCSCAYLQQYR